MFSYLISGWKRGGPRVAPNVMPDTGRWGPRDYLPDPDQPAQGDGHLPKSKQTPVSVDVGNGEVDHLDRKVLPSVRGKQRSAGTDTTLRITTD